MQDMDPNNCKILLEAIDCRSLSKVAQEHGYTPSGISHMISGLEAEVGFPLFVRSRQGVKPTANCLKLTPALREMLRWNEQLNQMASEMRGVTAGCITIGTYPSISIHWLPRIIKEFQADYPNIRIQIREGIRQELQEWLDDMMVELCFYTEKPDMKQHWIPLRDDPLVAVLPPDHPLAGASSYPIARCSDEKFIMPALGRDEDVMAVLDEAGVVPKVAFSTIENFAAISMIECGLGMSVMNELITRGFNSKAVIIPVSPPSHISFGIALPSLEKASPAALKFISYAERIIKAG